MKFPIRVIFVLFVFSSLVAAQDEPVYSPPIEFENEPTPERFMELEHPTADQLYLLPNPGPTEFNQLLPEQRGIYIDRLLQPGDYGPDKTGNRVIAVRFFSGSPDNIANHNEAFKVYLENVKNIDIVEVRGGGISLSSDGRKLSSSDASINLNDFDIKKNPLLGKQYKLSILDGKIYLSPKGSALLIPVKGDIKGSNGKLTLNDGSIDGMTIVLGTELSIDKNRILKGKAKEFNGVSFLFHETPFQYTKDKNLLTLDGAEITSVDKDVEFFVQGSTVIKKENLGNIKGNIKIKGGDSVSISEVNVDNSVKFSLPKRGYFKEGDKLDDVNLIQNMLKREGFLIEDYTEGTYDKVTFEAVKKWQEQIFKEAGTCMGSERTGYCQGDGLFGRKSLDFYNKKKSPIELKFRDDSLLSKGWGALSEAYEKFIKKEETGNEVSFTPSELDVKGKEPYTVTIPSIHFKALTSEEQLAKKPIINLPKKGYWSHGDSSEEVQKIQDALITAGYLDPQYKDPTKGYGQFGPKTDEALRKWQESVFVTSGDCIGSFIAGACVSDGKFGTKALNKYYGFNPVASIAVRPEEGRALLSVDGGMLGLEIDGGVTIGVQDNNRIRVGDENLRTNRDEIIREIKKSTEAAFDLPVEITLKGPDGEDISVVSNQPTIGVTEVGGKEEKKVTMWQGTKDRLKAIELGFDLLTNPEEGTKRIQGRIDEITKKVYGDRDLSEEEFDFLRGVTTMIGLGAKTAGWVGGGTGSMPEAGSFMLDYIGKKEKTRVSKPDMFIEAPIVQTAMEDMEDKIRARIAKGESGGVISSTTPGVLSDRSDEKEGQIKEGILLPTRSSAPDLFYSYHRFGLKAEYTKEGEVVKIKWIVDDRFDFTPPGVGGLGGGEYVSRFPVPRSNKDLEIKDGLLWSMANKEKYKIATEIPMHSEWETKTVVKG